MSNLTEGMTAPPVMPSDPQLCTRATPEKTLILGRTSSWENRNVYEKRRKLLAVCSYLLICLPSFLSLSFIFKIIQVVF